MAKALMMHQITLNLNITPAAVEPTWERFCMGIENFAEALNETIYNANYMCGEGFGASEVTAMQPVWTFSGRRYIDDEVQNFIFGSGVKYGLGDARKTEIQVIVPQEDGTITIECPVTIANLQEWNGASTDLSAISGELRFNGKPTITEA